MFELLSKLNSGELLALVAVIGGVIIMVTVCLATQWRVVRIAETEGALKQQMVDKGMSPAEIDQVLKAGQRPVSFATEAALKQHMVDKGMSAADIDQVLKAGQHPKEAALFAATGSDGGDRAALAKSMVEQGYGGEDIERVLKAYQPAAKQAEEKPIGNNA